MSDLVQLTGVVRTFHRGIEEIRAIDDVTLTIPRGEYLSVVGPSGSGKTTLLNMIGCVDKPTEGTVVLHGAEVENLSERALAAIRSTSIGFVFQHFFLIPTLSAADNVMLPARFNRQRRMSGLNEKARELLDMVGMGHRADHLPDELSGGEMQRVALARALINDPLMLLADEPTGNLDSVNAEEVIKLFEQLNSDGLTILVVTHNEELASGAHSTIHLHDGRIAYEKREPVSAPTARPSLEVLPGGEDVPEYVSGGTKRKWGSLPLALLAFVAGSLMVVSAFLNWITSTTGYRFTSLYVYSVSTYGGNFLVRTYHGRPSVIFTGFWPIAAGALTVVASVFILLRSRRAAWLVLISGALVGILSVINIVVIYAVLQPRDLAAGTYSLAHPGAGIWLCLGSALAATGIGLLALRSMRDEIAVDKAASGLAAQADTQDIKQAPA